MVSFGRKLQREQLKKQFKELKKEHKDLRKMSFAQFKEYYEQIMTRTKKQQAEQIVEAEENLDDLFMEEVEENDEKDSTSK